MPPSTRARRQAKTRKRKSVPSVNGQAEQALSYEKSEQRGQSYTHSTLSLRQRDVRTSSQNKNLEIVIKNLGYDHDDVILIRQKCR